MVTCIVKFYLDIKKLTFPKSRRNEKYERYAVNDVNIAKNNAVSNCFLCSKYREAYLPLHNNQAKASLSGFFKI